MLTWQWPLLAVISVVGVTAWILFIAGLVELCLGKPDDGLSRIPSLDAKCPARRERNIVHLRLVPRT